jgi:hypothetical protein
MCRKHFAMPNDTAQRQCCTFNELRDRAYVLADTGRYSDWKEVAAAIEAEDCPNAEKRLTADPIISTMLNTRCWQARNRP